MVSSSVSDKRDEEKIGKRGAQVAYEDGEVGACTSIAARLGVEENNRNLPGD
jgi:hypothetical protein